jgi:superfamily I DNA/RNA helicase
MDHNYWLTSDNARPKAVELIDEVRGEIIDRDSKELKVPHQELHRVASNRIHAVRELLATWFFASVGIVDHNDESKETFYLSTSPNAYFFASSNILPWTNWLGDLVTRVRGAIEKGEFPKEIEYGPPNCRRKLPLGPLVNYQFRDGRLIDCEFVFGSLPSAEIAEAVVEAAEPLEEIPSFGLKQIIRTIDVDQNDRIRGPKSGVFILMGGPGVGKTTVALHRIPYLVNEQVDYDEFGVRTEVLPDELFFKQSNMLVVVWKRHLVPYLRKCIEHLDMKEFPEENVSHVDDWIERTLRRYIRIGPGKGSVRIRDEPQPISDAKLLLTESEVDEFLASDFPLKATSSEQVSAVARSLRLAVEGTGKSSFIGFASSSYDFTISGIRALGDDFARQLPMPERLGKYNESLDSGLRKQIESLIDVESERATQFIDILRQFYESEIVANRLRSEYGEEFVSEFRQSTRDQAEARSLSHSDMFILLWIVHLITFGSRSKISKQKPLPEFSHVLIDEAQYYHPVVLRLFADLCQLPEGTMTIVGDLEQKISALGGLARWDEMNLDVPPDNIHRLVTNYRWSRQVFEFLKLVHDAFGIEEEMNPPRVWYSGEGRRPEIVVAPDRGVELQLVADSIAQLRDTHTSELWTIAVVVPDSAIEMARTALVDQLKSYGVRARWADPEDVKESVDHVIVTNFDSIVGLEFDAVYVIASDEGLPDLTPDHVRPNWVALTRARKFLHVSRVGTDAVFGFLQFAAYYN